MGFVKLSVPPPVYASNPLRGTRRNLLLLPLSMSSEIVGSRFHRFKKKKKIHSLHCPRAAALCLGDTAFVLTVLPVDETQPQPVAAAGWRGSAASVFEPKSENVTSTKTTFRLDCLRRTSKPWHLTLVWRITPSLMYFLAAWGESPFPQKPQNTSSSR